LTQRITMAVHLSFEYERERESKTDTETKIERKRKKKRDEEKSPLSSSSLIPPSLFFYQAAKEGHKRVVELLLQAGANIEEKDWNGMTALIWAVGIAPKSVVEVRKRKRKRDDISFLLTLSFCF
jgi:hypothetical protein